MKASIIISSVAVLCLMITIAETPTGRSDKEVKSFAVNPVAYLTSNKVVSKNINNITERKSSNREIKTADLTHILNYLKFDVSDYMNESEMAAEEIDETNFEYLKFNVGDYNTVNEAMPADETNFINDDFSYLKFDVNKYMSESDEQSTNIDESSNNGLSYLKFDVNKYYSSNSESVSIGDLPAIELN